MTKRNPNKPQTMTTRVGKYDIPVRDFRRPVIVHFASGEHPEDYGPYAFWTAVYKKPIPATKTSPRRDGIWGRARVGLSAGDRFDRMLKESKVDYIETKEERRAYARMWHNMAGGKNIAYIRPSTPEEVISWLQGHLPMAQFAWKFLSF